MVGTSASIPTPAREARPDALPVAGHHSLQPRGSLEHSNLSLIPGPADRGGQPSSARKSMLEGLVITKTQLTALSACPRLTLPTMYWSKAVSWQGVRRAYWPVMHVLGRRGLGVSCQMPATVGQDLQRLFNEQDSVCRTSFAAPLSRQPRACSIWPASRRRPVAAVGWP